MASKRSRSQGAPYDPGPDSQHEDMDIENDSKRARTLSRQEQCDDAKRKETDFNKLCAQFRKMAIHEDEMSSIKCTLRQLFVKDLNKRPQQQLIKDEIERSVRVLRQIQMEAWHLINFHLLRCLESRDDPDQNKRIDHLPRFDNNFFNRCISGVGINQFIPSKGEDIALNESISLFRQERERQAGYQRPTIMNWSSSKSALSIQMKTNARNMIVLHFYRRLSRYVKLRYDQPTKGIVHILIREAFQQWGPRREVAMMVREWLGKEPSIGNIERDLTYFIVKLYEMLVYMESRQDEEPNIKGNRVFSLFPVATSFIPAHIAIDSSVLHHMWTRIHQRLKQEKRVDRDPFKKFLVEAKRGLKLPSNKEFQLFRDDLWREHFDISKFETGRWKFAHYITTNGYDVSVLRKRDVIGGENPYLSKEEFDPKIARNFCATKIIGIDPGMRALCTTATVRTLEDDRFRPRQFFRFRKKKRVAATRKRSSRRRKKRLLRRKRRKLAGPVTRRVHLQRTNGKRSRGHQLLDMYAITQISTREYRHLAGFNKVRAWNEGIKQHEVAYGTLMHGMPSFKTASSSRYFERLKFVWAHINWLIDFCSHHAFRKWRFYQYVYKAKALSHVAERIVPVASKNTLVGFGNWSCRDGIKGHGTGPVKALKKELAKRATVRSVDEFRTSKRCFHCHAELSKAVFPKMVNGVPDGTIESRSVLHCESSECKTFWDRDVNASLNIMRVTTELFNNRARSEYLQR